MNKLLMCVLCVVALCAALVPCFADTSDGVLAEERVVILPADQAKWYISVVGNASDARYNQVIGWFDSNASLVKLKRQVHFCPVTADSPLYAERYAGNVKGLPTVRMQKSDGTVVYEAAGKNLPVTAAGLNGALASAVNETQGIFPLLPWRREMERRCPGRQPQPQPGPAPKLDPEPPPLDDRGVPEVEPEDVYQDWLVAPICGLAVIAGLCLGYGRKLKDKLTARQ